MTYCEIDADEYNFVSSAVYGVSFHPARRRFADMA